MSKNFNTSLLQSLVAIRRRMIGLGQYPTVFRPRGPYMQNTLGYGPVPVMRRRMETKICNQTLQE